MKDKIIGIIVDTVHKIGLEESVPKLQEFNKDSVIIGSKDALDSISLVRFIWELEERIAKEFKVEIEILKSSPDRNLFSFLKNVPSLADYVGLLIREKNDSSVSG